MKFGFRHSVWITVIAALAIAVVVAGPALTAHVKASAVKGSECSMMGRGGSQCCPVFKGSGTMGAAPGPVSMVVGKVVSVRRDGTLTVKLKPAAKKASSRLKAGDSVCVMLCGKGTTGTCPRPATKAAKYTCPMHSSATSAKPGKCPKCGMNLKQAGSRGK